MPTWALLLLAALSAATGVEMVRRERGQRAVSRRIAPWTQGPAAPVEDLGDSSSTTGDVPFARRRAALALALELADIETPADRFATRTIVGTLVGAVLVGAIITPPAGVAVLVGAPLLVWAFVSSRQRRRRTRFADQLAEAVQSIAGAMRAGHGLSSSMAMVAEDVPEPMAGELQRVVAAERVGVPLDEALAEAVRRTGSRDLQHLGLVAALQREVGGNGAEALDRIVEAIRRRDDLRRLVTTLTAQGRMSRWILTGLPIAMAGILMLVSDDFLSPLWQDPTGRVLAIGAIGMVAAGSIWIKRIVDIEV